MTTLEAFRQAIYDANNGVKEETYTLNTKSQAKELRRMLLRNGHVRECSHSRIHNTVDVVFTGS